MSTIREGRWACPSCGGIVLGRHESCPDCAAPRPAGVRFFLPEHAPIVTDPALLADAASGADWTCDACGGANKGAIDGHTVIHCIHCAEPRDNRDITTRVRDLAKAPSSAEEARAAERDEKREADRERRAARAHGAPSSLSSGKRRGLLRPELLADPSIAPMTVESARAELDRRRAAPPAPSTAARTAFPWGILLGIAAAILTAALIASVFITTRSSAEVVGGTWKRTVGIDAYTRVQDEGWTPPADAHVLSRQTRQSGTQQVVVGYRSETYTETVQTGTESYSCGTRDMGNGYFQDRTCTRPTYGNRTATRQVPIMATEPVYDTWETWEVDRWRPIRKISTEGGLDRAPVWPTPKLAQGGRPGAKALLGAERIGNRDETYHLQVRPNGGEAVDVRVSASEWDAAVRARFVDIRRNIWGGRRSILVGSSS